jgi:hypothetical protein
MRVIESIGRDIAVSQLGSRVAPLLGPGEYFDVYECSPAELLCSRRLDLAIKYEYVKFKARGLKSEFATAAYLEHIRAFNGFVEADSSGKISGSSFLSSFDFIIRNLQAHGYSEESLVPISADGVILDGAHRVAACLYLGLNVRVIKTQVIQGPSFDAAFFHARGMRDTYVDAAVAAYIQIQPSARMMLVWPTAQGREWELMKLVKKSSVLVYRREIFLFGDGPIHLVANTYAQEPWLGGPEDGFAGARNKAANCFANQGPLRVLVLEDGKDLVACKEAVRALFGRDKHAVHINDSHDQTRSLAEVLLNSNTIHFVNHAPMWEFAWFKRLFEDYGCWLLAKGPDKAADFCIDGSAVLAAYGVRDVRDLDYIRGGIGHCQATGFKEISERIDPEGYYGISGLDIVYDPRNHFYAHGMKMISLALTRGMKERRAEPKDLDDLFMLDRLLATGKASMPTKYVIRRILRPRFIKGRFKLVALRIRYHLRSLAK